jgi:predicted cobalt transporter CbtA
MTSARNFLIRGLLAGLVAGLVAFGVAYIVGESSVNASIAIEESGPASHHSGEELVPRSLQSTAGLLTGTVTAGVALGGLVGVITALALGRLGRLGVRGVSLAVAAMGFGSVSLVPFLVYPPNPPAVGHSETIGIRTALYFILVAISIIAAVTAVLIGRKLADRWDAWHATLVAIAGYLLVIIAIATLLPTYNEVPADFPASVLYEFRMASLITQLALWGTIGVILGELLHRVQRDTERDVIERDYTEQQAL